MQVIAKIKQFAFLIPVLVLAVTVLPVALANADVDDKPTATVSRTVKQLRKQVKALKQQVVAITGQVGSPRPPGGPAGGDLVGVFPDPTIAKDAVAAAEIKDNTVGAAEIEDDAITSAEIKVGAVQAEEIGNDAVGADEIATGGVGAPEITGSAVGATELDEIKTAVSPNGTAIGAGQNGSATVTCPGETVLIAGGFAWADIEANSVIYSSPSESNPDKSWTVRGFVPSGSNVLYAWATCLQV